MRSVLSRTIYRSFAEQSLAVDGGGYAAFSKLADQNSLSTHLPDSAPRRISYASPIYLPVSKNTATMRTSPPTPARTSPTTAPIASAASTRSVSTPTRGTSSPTRSAPHSRDSTGHKDKFTTYATDGNVVDQSFNTYGTTATGGEGEFSSYNAKVNVPNLRFTAYSDSSNGREQSFAEYTKKPMPATRVSPATARTATAPQ
ncbi:hypothetical protein BUALT_Bualt17G0046600 [Buddleja alternifolia]|uniref:Uncharacterized protein n=1 Tax=Buddleja alternifolia TaxID=168488 RepID=A0AAV6W6S6_9LAMI|nr:hypothetical protein BUALT_Bualt17G0046600 [Buddleja alternifolia]